MTQIQALYFDGQGTKIIVNEQESLRITTYTVEVLLKPDGIPDQPWKGIVGKPGRNFNIWLRQDGGIYHCFHTESSDHEAVPDTNDGAAQGPLGGITPNQWHHVAITNDGRVAKTYINGQLHQTHQIDSPLVVDETPLYIGCNLDAANNHYFKGALSEIRIWNKVRTEAEIQANLLGQLTGQEEGLVAYYPFNEGQGSEIHDRTGQTTPGEITGTVTWIESDLNIGSENSPTPTDPQDTPPSYNSPPMMDVPHGTILKNQSNGYVLDVLKGEAKSGSMVWGYAPNDSLSQKWEITPEGLIKSQLGEWVLDLQDIPGFEWAKKVVLNPINGHQTQQWIVSDRGIIVNQSNNFALAMVEKDGIQAVVAYPVSDPKPNEQWVLVE
ncbi:ricin-type beta-trefoil lectin domain protein [Spirulina sp. CS-785/01]|uniref:LamG-like jellyroll fold domain-containing protein n=1 Tax=Spirulina sp. CS-785/01 TaxID=3021716 RepID=UPI002330A832|nr:LamG-like jellyroll fold domain-containing protein [Spirulina sp. CS-785/01]MDB9313690.1 ricin-type beta-trefoil lectin domain protein [Spirulina sp. CS-785/01]